MHQLTKDLNRLCQLLETDKWLCNYIRSKLDGYQTFKELEQEYLLFVYEREGGNIELVKKRTGMSRQTIYRKLADYGVIRDWKTARKPYKKRGGKRVKSAA